MGKYENLQLFKLDPWQKSRDKRNMVETVSVHTCCRVDYSLLLSQKIGLKNRQSICTKRNFYYICKYVEVNISHQNHMGECGVHAAANNNFCDVELLFQNV